MAMENKRITQLSTERLTLTSGDYVMVDDADNGSAKYRLDRLKETDNTLSVSGKAADAAATGQAISDEAEARDNADNALGEDIGDLKSAFNHLAIGKNLIGEALNKLYPVFIPKGTSITISRADGQSMQSLFGVKIYLYASDRSTLTYYGLDVSGTSRTITYSVNDVYYLSHNSAIPLMVEFGSTASEYIKYWGAPVETVENINNLRNEIVRTTICKNLIGEETNKLYPVFIAKGEPFTVSRADGANMSSMSGKKIYLYASDESLLNDYGLDVNATSKTITYREDVYYISSNSIDALQVEKGIEKTEYVKYFPPLVLANEEIKALHNSTDEIRSVLSCDVITSARWISGNIASSNETMGKVSNNAKRICIPTIFHILPGSYVKIKAGGQGHIRLLEMTKFGEFKTDLGWLSSFIAQEEKYIMIMLSADDYDTVIGKEFAENIEMHLLTPRAGKTEIRFKALYNIGDCILIKFHNGETMLIDTGSAYDYTAGGNIKAWLKENGVSKFDYIMISHYHGDHMGNIASICQDFDVSNCTFLLPPAPPSTYVTDNFYTHYQEVMTAVGDNPYIIDWNKLNTKNRYPYFFGDVPVYMYNTDHSNFYEKETDDPNNMCICPLFELNNTSILFTGDAAYYGSNLDYETETAQAILASEVNRIVTILKTPHHGIDGINSMNFALPTKINAELYISSSPTYRSTYESNYNNSCWIAITEANNITHLLTGICCEPSEDIGLIINEGGYIVDGYNHQKRQSVNRFSRYKFLKDSVVKSVPISATTTEQGNVNTGLYVTQCVVVGADIRRTDDNRICFCEIGNYTGSTWGLKLRSEYQISEVVAEAPISGTVYYIPLFVENNAD